MDCPNCKTWNPDDKIKCWRCGEELPRPQPQKKRQPRIVLGLPVWTWVVMGLFLSVWLLLQCAAPALVPPA